MIPTPHRNNGRVLPVALVHLGFTKTEGKIVAILADGEAHRWQELFECLPDELGAKINLQVHICYIRKKLAIDHLDVVARQNGGDTYYRMVRHISCPYT